MRLPPGRRRRRASTKSIVGSLPRGARFLVVAVLAAADLFLTFGDPAEGGETQVVALALAGKNSVLGC